MNLQFALVALLCCVAAANLHESCVLEADGSNTCVKSNALLSSIRMSGAPCARNNMNCWCIKAVEYTNAVRRRNGVNTPLRVGTMNQLTNAVQYSRVLSGFPTLRHQVLQEATRTVGCKRWIGGENIAYNYESNDIALACVTQWETSPPHLRNILNGRFEEVVVGFHFAANGRVYCTQTFAYKQDFGTFGSENDSGCNAVRGGSNSNPTTRPRPTPRATRRPTTRPPPRTTRPPRATRRPTPRPTSDTQAQFMREGNRSCRCLEADTRCWNRLGPRSGNRCVPRMSAVRQPIQCKLACCIFCRTYRNHRLCRGRRVRSICYGYSR